ncbi:MAG: transglycosylase SLT domain-containing protein [Chloracidobacterium sp.]|nr:transglycosylase SLT domain-containing protein [Chloracidobacterium sp.]
MYRFLASLLLAALLALNAAPQPREELQRPNEQSISAPNGEDMITHLRDAFREDTARFDSGNSGYRLAHLSDLAGQPARAIAWFHREAGLGKGLDGFALARSSRIARSSGNLLLERIYLEQLRTIGPDTELARASLDRLAENSLERSDPASASRLLTSGAATSMADGTYGSVNRKRTLLLAKAYVGLGRADDAVRLFTGLIDDDPPPQTPDDSSYDAVRALDQATAGTATQLTPEEHRRRANIYQFHRDLTPARRHFEALAGIDPASAAEAYLNIGRGYGQAGDYGEAVKWYERLLERNGNSPEAKDALLRLAGAYSRIGKVKESLARYQSFIDKYPSDASLDRAYLNPVDLLRDDANDTSALNWCERTATAFRGNAAEAVAVFSKARIHVSREEWQDALATLDSLAVMRDLGGTSLPGGTNAEEITFLRGVILEKLSRYGEAIDAYLSIPDGRDEYHGWRATQRLGAMYSAEASRAAAGEKIKMLVAGLQEKDIEARRKKAAALYRMAADNETREKALVALRTSFKLPARSPFTTPVKPKEAFADKTVEALVRVGAYSDAAVRLAAKSGDPASAEVFVRGDRADKALLSLEPLWAKVPPDTPLVLIPRDQLRMQYPAVYRKDLLAAVEKNGVDPRLVLSIMRQESRFAPHALSGAGARGLMQFLSTTATEVEREVDVQGFEQGDLYSPQIAILFGSQHIADLFRLFPGQPEAVVAAYNAGSDNTKRWLARSRSDDPSRYVSEIMFTQTKDYVYRVMANYRMYQMLYDDKLQPVGDPAAQDR